MASQPQPSVPVEIRVTVKVGDDEFEESVQVTATANSPFRIARSALQGVTDTTMSRLRYVSDQRELF